jgi:hypothetical protein
MKERKEEYVEVSRIVVKNNSDKEWIQFNINVDGFKLIDISENNARFIMEKLVEYLNGKGGQS